MTMDRRSWLKAAGIALGLTGATVVGDMINPFPKYEALGFLEYAVASPDKKRHAEDWRINQFIETLLEYYKLDSEPGSSKDGREQKKRSESLWIKARALDPVGFCSTNDITKRNDLLETIGFVYDPLIRQPGGVHLGKIVSGPDWQHFTDWGFSDRYKHIIFDSTGYLPIPDSRVQLRSNFRFNDKVYTDIRGVRIEEDVFDFMCRRMQKRIPMNTDDLLFAEAYKYVAQEAGLRDGSCLFDAEGKIDDNTHNTFVSMIDRIGRHHEPAHKYSSNERWAYTTQLAFADSMMDLAYGFWQLQSIYPGMYSEETKRIFLETKGFEERKEIFREIGCNLDIINCKN